MGKSKNTLKQKKIKFEQNICDWKMAKRQLSPVLLKGEYLEK